MERKLRGVDTEYRKFLDDVGMAIYYLKNPKIAVAGGLPNLLKKVEASISTRDFSDDGNKGKHALDAVSQYRNAKARTVRKDLKDE